MAHGALCTEEGYGKLLLLTGEPAKFNPNQQSIRCPRPVTAALIRINTNLDGCTPKDDVKNGFLAKDQKHNKNRHVGKGEGKVDTFHTLNMHVCVQNRGMENKT